MRVLLVDNDPLDLNTCSYVDGNIESETELRYSILDSNEKDFFFIPLLYLEEVTRPVAVLSVGRHVIHLPLDSALLICDKDSGEGDIIELKNINDREFDAFVFNPISGYRPEYMEINLENIYPDAKWVIPKTKYGHFIAVPIEDRIGSDCIFIIRNYRDVLSKNGLDMTDIL